MSGPPLLCIASHSPDETAAFAGALASLIRPGDVLLLEGPIGAGKTHFARALIQTLQGPDLAEDIPSPTFTLVQTYETRSGDVWHADLYRLTGADDVLELGLDAAFETAICLVEWPDRLGEFAPRTALHLRFSPAGETRRDISLSGADDWASRLAPLDSVPAR